MESTKVILMPEGYIEIALSGDLTAAMIEDLERQVLPVVEQLENRQQPVLSLVDLSGAGNYSPGSNKASMSLMEKISYDKVAMFGANFALKEVVKLITMAMGKNENTRIFSTRDEALAWLTGADATSNPVQ